MLNAENRAGRVGKDDNKQITGLGHESNTGIANPMTRKTWDRLLSQIKDEEHKAEESNKQKGEAAGANSDWHDNPAYDQAILDARLAESRLNTLHGKVDKVIIIEPRQETDVADLGNNVVLRFEGEDEDETFVLLGPDDAITGIELEPRWISTETPIGKAILGKSAGTTVSIRTPDGEIKAKIKRILPGTF